MSASSFTVTAGSHLTNYGGISATDGILVEGVLDGGGRFGDTVILSGGELELGGTAAPEFGNLTVEAGGRLDFQVAPAENGAAPMVRVSDALVVEDGADITISLTPAYVFSDAIGKNTTWNMVELGASADAALAGDLQDNTRFRVVSDGAELTLDELNMQVRRYAWTTDGNSLTLNATLGYVHHEVLTWANDEGNRVWDTASANWYGEDGYDTVFDYGYTCRFSDEGAGVVTLTGALDPDAVEVDSASDYVFTGDGSIINGSLTKSGEGSLTITTANSYEGGTVIQGGTLAVGHEEALGLGEVRLKGGVLDMAGEAIGNDIVAEGGALSHAGNYDGDISVAGSVRVEDSARARNWDFASDAGAKLQLGETSIQSAEGKAGHMAGTTIERTQDASGTDTVSIYGASDAPAVLDDVHIDIALGATLEFRSVRLNSGVRITDDPAHAVFHDASLTIENGVNVTRTEVTQLPGLELVDSDRLTLVSFSGTLKQLEIESDALTSVTIGGTDLTVFFEGFDCEGIDVVRLVFGSGGMSVCFDAGSALEVTGVFGGESYTGLWKEGDANGVYFSLTGKASSIPEPATTTLSLLALAALALRRRRKAA